MIKIIKPGTKEVAKCDNCGCEFSYEEEDVIHMERGRYNDEEWVKGIKHGYKRYVICPQCEKKFVIEQIRAN